MVLRSSNSNRANLRTSTTLSYHIALDLPWRSHSSPSPQFQYPFALRTTLQFRVLGLQAEAERVKRQSRIRDLSYSPSILQDSSSTAAGLLASSSYTTGFACKITLIRVAFPSAARHAPETMIMKVLKYEGRCRNRQRLPGHGSVCDHLCSGTKQADHTGHDLTSDAVQH